MVSSYQGDVKVEIAFGSGFGTPAASRSWTDVSAYVELAEGINISGGRQDERSTTDANQLSLTLDNSDGRFTAGLATSPYYPNVKLDVPIRVTNDPVDGAISTRYLGYINEWPVEWNGTSAYAKAAITASSRLSRMGYRAALKSVPEIAILGDSPLAYYTLEEPADSTQANDSSGNNAPPMTLTGDPAFPVVFGNATGPGTDGLTAAEFTNASNGQYLTTQVTTASGSLTIEMSVLVPTTATGGTHLFGFLNSSTNMMAAEITGTGTVRVTGANAASNVQAVNALSLGSTHHLAVTVSGTTWTIYVDGVSVGSSAVSAVPAGTYTFTVGGFQVPDVMASFPVAANAASTHAHVAIWNSVLTAPQVLAHSDAELTGYAGETTDARLKRYAGYASIPVAEISAEAGSTTMAHVDTTGKQVLELLRIVEATEGGVLYDERDGTLTFHNRAHRYQVSAAFTLDMSEQEVEADYQPLLERTYLLNNVTAKDVTGSYTGHNVDATSLAAYGPMTADLETASDSPYEPLNLASWTVATYKDPRVRVASCSVNALAQVGKTPNCAAVMAATVGSKVTVSNHPSQAAASSVSYFVEGWTETYGPESMTITWNLSPTSPWDLTLIIGDGARGFIGTNPIAF